MCSYCSHVFIHVLVCVHICLYMSNVHYCMFVLMCSFVMCSYVYSMLTCVHMCLYVFIVNVQCSNNMFDVHYCMYVLMCSFVTCSYVYSMFTCEHMCSNLFTDKFVCVLYVFKNVFQYFNMSRLYGVRCAQKNMHLRTS